MRSPRGMNHALGKRLVDRGHRGTAWTLRRATNAARLPHGRASTWVIVATTILATIAATLVFVNFMPGEKKIEQEVTRLYGTSDPQFRRSMSVLLGPPILDGNRFEVLRNGDEIFPSMLTAIGGAQKSITFETYIYWSGDVGRRFAEALMQRARAGVRVHILLDWVGSAKMDAKLLRVMEDSGIEVRRYHEPRWYNLGRLNNRTHRKVLVVDGRIGFTGGVGISDTWSGHAQDADHWRDTHVRVEGPVVGQMQGVFMDNWTKATGKVLHGDAYFPALETVGQGAAQMFESSPTGGSESMHLMYLLAITAAERSIALSSSYFVPDDLAVNALVAALKRGVMVQIITPGPIIDTNTVRNASRAQWGALLEAGAEMYEYQPTMFHVKVMVVDSLLVSVGSTNFDNRSFQLNDEANLNILDAEFARQQIQVFGEDLAKSRRYTLEAYRNRPLRERVLERAASLLEAQL
ncbi:MAG: phospholipase D-like domain-containing protein [Pseudomonadota bacterium]|nr:phospholipase D-like domain-containing protein [Pseudomonadota bacterium]